MYKDNFSFLESSKELTMFHLPTQLVLTVLHLKGMVSFVLKARKQNNSHTAENIYTENNIEAHFSSTLIRATDCINYNN